MKLARGSHRFSSVIEATRFLDALRQCESAIWFFRERIIRAKLSAGTLLKGNYTMAKKTKGAAKKSASSTTKKTATKRATTAKKATRSASASGAKKKSAKATKAAKPKAPFITTEQGAKALQYYCEGIMDMVGEYILIRNPKISQKSFTTEAHAMIRGIFGMNEKRAAR